MLRNDYRMETLVSPFRIRNTIAPHGCCDNPTLGVLIDTDDGAQRELLNKLRGVYQERSEIIALSERFFVLILMLKGPQGEMVA